MVDTDVGWFVYRNQLKFGADKILFLDVVHRSDQSQRFSGRVVVGAWGARENGIEFLAGKDLRVSAITQRRVGVRCVVWNNEDRIARLQADADVDSSAVLGIDAAQNRQRQIGPLILLDPSVFDRLEKRVAVAADNRARLEVD